LGVRHDIYPARGRKLVSGQGYIKQNSRYHFSIQQGKTMTAQLLDKPHPIAFTIAQFELMYERCIFTESDRIELINGEVIEMSPIGLKHAVCVSRLSNKLMQKLGLKIIVWSQNPINIGIKSQPQPDIAVLKYRDDFYKEALPTPADILLIIEVADSSFEYDRDIKSKLYAAAGIPQMWLFDVNDDMITGFAYPSELGYKQINRYTKGDNLSITAFDNVIFEWEELF
jgi:Uma2 family endonuclease